MPKYWAFARSGEWAQPWQNGVRRVTHDPRSPHALVRRARKALENMILYQFCKHLAVEIGNFPAEPNSATQSYAVTTAALARKILAT